MPGDAIVEQAKGVLTLRFGISSYEHAQPTDDTDETREVREASPTRHRRWRYSSAVEAARHLRRPGTRA